MESFDKYPMPGDILAMLFLVTDCAVVRYGVIPSDWLCGSALWCYSL